MSSWALTGRWILLNVAVGGCGRLNFDAGGDASVDTPFIETHDDAGFGPIHHYPLITSLADNLGGPPAVSLGGQLRADGYRFGPNQGLSLASAMPSSVYTIDATVEIDSIPTQGWRKLIDFKNLTTDEGLYYFDVDKFQFVVVAGTSFATSDGGVVSAGTVHRITLTRDASATVAGYVDGIVRFSFVDTAAVATFSAPQQMAEMVVDDTTTSQGEADGGTIRDVTIWDVPLTAAQISSL